MGRPTGPGSRGRAAPRRRRNRQEGDERVVLERIVGVGRGVEVQVVGHDRPVDARAVQRGAEQVARRDAHADGRPAGVVGVGRAPARRRRCSRACGTARSATPRVKLSLPACAISVSQPSGAFGARRERCRKGAEPVEADQRVVDHVAVGVGQRHADRRAVASQQAIGAVVVAAEQAAEADRLAGPVDRPIGVEIALVRRSAPYPTALGRL